MGLHILFNAISVVPNEENASLIFRFNEDHADIEMPPGYYGQEVLTRCLDAVSIDSPEHAAAQEEMQLVAGKYGLDAVMDEYDLDALVCVREGCHSLANMVGAPIGKSCSMHSCSTLLQCCCNSFSVPVTRAPLPQCVQQSIGCSAYNLQADAQPLSLSAFSATTPRSELTSSTGADQRGP